MKCQKMAMRKRRDYFKKCSYWRKFNNMGASLKSYFSIAFYIE